MRIGCWPITARPTVAVNFFGTPDTLGEVIAGLVYDTIVWPTQPCNPKEEQRRL
jgi:hypothetical protein